MVSDFAIVMQNGVGDNLAQFFMAGLNLANDVAYATVGRTI